jgi:hypothetical protein
MTRSNETLRDYKDVSLQDGEDLLGCAFNTYKRYLTSHPAVRRGMPPESVRKALSTSQIANEVAPSAPSLRQSLAKALHERAGWAVDPDDLNAALSRWLDSRLEECLREIWTSERRVTVRVTRNGISIESERGLSGPDTGRLPS